MTGSLCDLKGSVPRQTGRGTRESGEAEVLCTRNSSFMVHTTGYQCLEGVNDAASSRDIM
jgi:hypothetical protein